MEDWERKDRDTRINEFRVALIYEVLEEVYPEHMSKLRGASEQLDQAATFPEVLRIDPPPPERRSPIPLMPIQISEDTISGNIEILKNVFRNQLSFSDQYFEGRPAVLV